MSVDSTLLMKEVDNVTANGNSFSSNRYKFQVLANNVWIDPVRLEYINLTRDFSSGQLGDIVDVQFLMNYGDYAYDLFPYKDDLKADLTEIPLQETGNNTNWSKKTTSKRYKALLQIVNPVDNPAITQKQAALQGRDAMNRVGMITVKIKLIDEIVYKLMMVSLGETLQSTTTMNALLFLHTREAQKIKGNDDSIITNHNVADGYNTTVRAQIPFTDGMLLKDVAKYLQNDEGGIYATGCGRYIQDQIFYVYPLFDITRYKKKVKVLNLINVPNDRYEGAERTYIDSDNSLTVICTGDSGVVDQSTEKKIQEGNGLRFGNLDTMLSGFSNVKDNKMLVDRATNLFETTTKSLADGFNNIRWAAQRFTSNPMKYFTQMAQKDGQKMETTWTRGVPSLLYPGMPVKYQTIKDDVVKTYYGVLLGVDDHKTPAEAGNAISKWVNKTKLSVYLSQQTAEELEAAATTTTASS